MIVNLLYFTVGMIAGVMTMALFKINVEIYTVNKEELEENKYDHTYEESDNDNDIPRVD